jgi:membrane associated rhomboid family serine protease
MRPMIPFLILLNVIVYFLWHRPTFLTFMADNFLVSWEAIDAGRWWVLVTSNFSHNMLFHILINMLVLNNFGTLIEALLGSKFILKFYLIAGVVSGLSHAMVSAFILGDPGLPALGASGSIVGLILIFSMLFPKEKILLLGFIPMPAIVGAVAFIGLDLWGLMAQAEGGGLPIGHGAHLGGAFTGIIWYFFLIRPKLAQLRA